MAEALSLVAQAVSQLMQHTWRGLCSMCGMAAELLQTGQWWRTACSERAVRRKHRPALEPALGSLTDSFATAGGLHGSRFHLEMGRTIPALSVSLQGLPLDLGSVAPAAVGVCSMSAEHSSTKQQPRGSALPLVEQLRESLKNLQFYSKMPKWQTLWRWQYVGELAMGGK